jgi:hypothetical protein
LLVRSEADSLGRPRGIGAALSFGVGTPDDGSLILRSRGRTVAAI